MKNLISDDIIHLVNSATNLDFKRSVISEPGWEIEAIRLNDDHFHYSEEPGPLFDIGLINEPSHARVLLKPDRFAGQFVRLVQGALREKPSIWAHFLEAIEMEDIETQVQINEEIVEIHQLPKDRWQTFEIECKKRIPPSEKSNRNEFIKDVITVSLGMILTTNIFEFHDESSEESGLPEGAKTSILVNKYERNLTNRMLCIKHHGTQCWVCEISFEEIYGDLGKDFIQVHHVTPVSQLGTDYVIKPKKDLIPVCSNCHSMIHRNRNDPLMPNQLRKIIGKSEKN